MKEQKPLAPTPGFREILAKCTPADFDGHTEFYRMTAEQRLDALASLARFVHKYKGLANRQQARK